MKLQTLIESKSGSPSWNSSGYGAILSTTEETT